MVKSCYTKNMSRKILFLFLVGIYIFNNGLAYPADLFSLDVLVKDAREKNPEILAAKKRWEAAKLRVPQAKAWDDPVVGVKFEKIPRGTIKFERTMPDDRILSVAQSIPLLGKLSLKGKIALVQAQMSASEYKNEELNVIKGVKSAYYDLFMAQKEIELKELSMAFLNDISQVAEAKYVVSSVSYAQILKIHLEISRLSNDIENLKKGLLSKEAKLNSLMNVSQENKIGTISLKDVHSFDKESGVLQKLAQENSPELKIFSYMIEQNKHAKALVKKNIFPDIMTEVALRGITSAAIGPWDLALSLSLPLWFWSKQRYEIKEAVVNIEEAEAVYNAMKNRLSWEITNLVNRVYIAQNKIKLYKTNLLSLSDNSLESLRASYLSNGADFGDLLDALRMFIDIKMSYYSALVEYNMNLAELEALVGGINGEK